MRAEFRLRVVAGATSTRLHLTTSVGKRRNGQFRVIPLLATSGGPAHGDLRRLNPQQRKSDLLTSSIDRTPGAR